MLGRVRTAVIWNPSAGSATQAASVRQALQALPHVTMHTPGGRIAAIKEAAALADDGTELIIAAGGDGTVSSVIEGVVRSEQTPVVGILPLGTGNDLARSLEIPLAPSQAVRWMSAGALTKVDVLRLTSSAGERICANMVTGGNTGRYLQHLTHGDKAKWGPFCYLRGVLDVLFDLHTYQIELICDGGPPESFKALNVFISNGRFSGGGLPVSPRAMLDDGQVDIIIVRDGDPGDIVSLTTRYVLADYLGHELVEFRRADHVTIRSENPLPLTADGDSIGTTPLSIHVDRERLRVLVPSGFPAASAAVNASIRSDDV